MSQEIKKSWSSFYMLIYLLDTVRRIMMQSRGDDDITKIHKDNSFELCWFLNNQLWIAQMNNKKHKKNCPKRDDDRQVSTQPSNFFASLKSNKI